MDDNILKRDIRKNANDPFLNLNRFGDNTIEEGFCSSSTQDQKEIADLGNITGNVVHQSIIKRFNQHSFLVLKTCKEQQSTPTANNKTEAPLVPLEKAKRHAIQEVAEQLEDESEDAQKIKKQKILEKIHYDDLDVNDSDGHRTIEKGLNLDKLEKHLFGSNTNSLVDKTLSTSSNEKINTVEFSDQYIRKMVKDWNQRITHRQLINPSMAVNALGELSPGGVLMRGYHNLSNFVPSEVEREVSNLYLSAGELLKEFWSSFPPINSELENKAIKMHDTLQRFNASKLKAFEDRISRDLSPLSSQILHHLNLLIDTAFRKFQRRIKIKESKY